MKEKVRQIRYAGHRDTAIYARYSARLSSRYEDALAEHDLGATVLAYRSGIGYNVPFAKSLFDEIRGRGDCKVVCLDISSFFDRLRHDHLKRALLAVLGDEKLPDDWYKIYRRLTRFEFVERSDIEAVLGRVRGARICSIEVFRSKIRQLIQSNPDVFGVPQGTALSGLLANIYMLDFDREVDARLRALGGSYRRYSDDIALVLPADADAMEAVQWVSELSQRYGLEINAAKTAVSTFSKSQAGLACTGDRLQYLGFTFDGVRTLIRAESMKAFYARMKANIRRYVGQAARRGIALDALRRRVLVGRFTHWGDARNFVQYAYRAAREMNAPEIKHQLRRHVEVFDETWASSKEYYSRLYGV